LAGDKGYDTRPFVADARFLKVTPHVAQNTSGRSSAIDGRTTRHAGYLESQVKRKRVEEVFGWLKTIGLMRKTRYRGARRVGWMFTFAAAAYNLVRIRTVTAARAGRAALSGRSACSNRARRASERPHRGFAQHGPGLKSEETWSLNIILPQPASPELAGLADTRDPIPRAVPSPV